jgi:O-antigen/teichoic acid export membrane protein
MVLSVAAMVVQFPFSIAAQVCAARVTGVEGFGAFGYLQTGTMLVFPFVGFPAVFGIPMHVAVNASESRRAHAALLVSVICCFAVGVFCSPLWSWFSARVPFIRVAAKWDAAMWTLGATALAYRTGVEFLFVGNRDFLRRGVVALLHPVAFAIITVFLFAIRVRVSGNELYGYWTASLTVTAIASWLFVRRRLDGPRGWHFETAKRLAALGFKGLLVIFGLSWLHRSPFLVAERHLSAATLGLWTGISTFTDMFRQVTGAIGRALIPFAARQSTKTTTILTVQLLGLIAIIGFAITLLAPTTLMRVMFGNEFVDPDYVFLASYPGIIAAGISTVIAQALAAWGYPRVTYLAPMVAMIVGLLLYALQRPLTPTWFGVVFAIAQLVALGPQLIAYHRGEAIRLRDWFALRPLGTATRSTMRHALDRVAHRGAKER